LHEIMGVVWLDATVSKHKLNNPFSQCEAWKRSSNLPKLFFKLLTDKYCILY